MPRWLIVLFLVGCPSLDAPWPYAVSLGGGPVGVLPSEPPLDCTAPVATATISPAAGTARASDYLLGPPDHVLTELPEGPRWLSVAAPVTPAERAWLAGLTEGCPSVLVRPFAGGRQAVVDTDAGIFVVDLDHRRARLLDPRHAMLEGCAMSADREALRCSIDLSFGSARFDREGRELEGNFTPDWSR